MIRRLTPADATLLPLLQSSPPPPSATADVWQNMTDEKWQTLLAAPEDSGQFLLGAFSADDSTPPTLQGIIGLRREARPTIRHKASLWGLHVVPDARRQGIGTQLVTAFLDAAQQLDGLEMIRPVVPADNAPAITLLQKHGFQTYAVEPQARCIDGTYHDDAFLYRLLDQETHEQPEGESA